MAQRFLGPTGSRRRRRTLLGPTLLMAVVALMLTTGAQAVHDVSVFQLDTPSADAQVSVGATAHHDDWDVICKANPSTCTLKAGFETAVDTSSSASSHQNDGALNASIFTGGGSKDISGISSGAWAWKDESGGLPDKDNLLHAYAARYSTAPSAECPVGSGLTSCELIYFGSDRYANDGDATQAFWFLQNRVALGSNPIGGGQGFTGTHRNGDLLIISEFSNGGTKSTITIYKWVCGAPGTGPACDTGGSLQFVTGGENQKCGGSSPDPFCGIVNESLTPTPSPWPFLDKDGSTAFRQGELFEAGINLSDPSINLSSECFSSFVAETRSSTSTNAQLKDFVIGQFQPCGITLATTPSVGAAGEVSPGQQVTDTATVLGQGIANPPTPSGNVTFFVCAFPAGSADLCDGSAGKVGNQVGSPVALADSSPPPGEASAISAAVNTAASPLAPGRYCFRAEWPGDGNYVPPNPAGKFIHFGSGNSECFIVRQLVTQTVTTPSDGSGVALASPVLLGTELFDRAVVTGSAAGGAPTGTVAFSVCNPTQVTGGPGAEVCAAGAGTPVGSPVALVAIGGSSPPAAAALSSPGVAANQPGVWCFRASYTPAAGSPYLPSDDANHTECVTVNQAPTTTVTTPSDDSGSPLGSPVALGTLLFDRAVVTGTAAGGTPTGTVAFWLCNPSQVTGGAGTEVCAAGAGTPVGSSVALVAIGGSSPPAAAALSSPGVAGNQAGVWCFRATYTPATGSPYLGSSDANHNECVTVNPAGTGTVTTPLSGGNPITGPLAVGSSVTDRAVVTGSSADGFPSGTIEFFVCNPAEVSSNGGTCSSGGSPAGIKPATEVSGANPPQSQATSDPVLVNTVGTWCFRARYVPGGVNGANYTGSSDASTSECFVVQASTSIASVQDWLPNDTATVSAAGGTALNGTLSFTLYETDDCTGTPVSDQSYSFPLVNASSDAERTKSTANSSYLVKASKSVSWKIEFTPAAGSNVTGSSHCEKTTLAITN